MNPVSQSCPIPLAEGICCTISDMNADQVMVTQETLMEQLGKNYPGIAAPSHNIFHDILGTLIKERKIYHTGEGYFIVTPNTYYTTNDAREDNRKVLLEDSCCCSSPSTTYLVNIKHCADLVKENIPTVSCYRSCHCFPDQNMLSEQRHRQLMSHEPKGQGKKGCSEFKPLIQTQGISTSAEKHSWDTIKSLTSLKAKLKSKRFGLGLFWRSVSKKEKHKKEYSTFSAQFPPKEWPVRGEDDLDNIPRDIEHEIIRRINPMLTVDNLIRHTLLMKRFEEQKKYISEEKKHISNGTLAEVSTVRQKHLSKDCIQKAQSKTAKHTKKMKSQKEQQLSRSSRKSHTWELTPQNVQVEENLSLSVRHQKPPAVAVQSQVIYKKQITNPFQGLPWRRGFYFRGSRGVGDSQPKRGAGRRGRGSQRPWCRGSCQPRGCARAQLAATDRQHTLLQPGGSCRHLHKLRRSGNCSYLQIGNRSQYFLDSDVSEENICRRTVKKNPRDIKKSPCTCTEGSGVCKEAKLPFYLKEEHCRCKADTVCELLDRTAKEFQNVHLSNYMASANLDKKKGVKYRQKTDKKSELIFNRDYASHHGSVKLEGEGLTGKCHLLNPKGHDGDTHNSFCLGASAEGPEPCHPLPPGHAFSDRGWSTAVPPNTWDGSTCPAQCDTPGTRDSGEHGYNGSGSSAEPMDGSKEHPNPDFTEQKWLCSQVLPKGHRKDEGTGPPERGKVPAVADFCFTNTSQKFTREVGEGEGGGCCAMGSQSKDIRNPLGKKGLFFKNTCSVTSGQKYSGGTENHSITGDSGIDSPR
ncbi:STOX1 protein, partial [Serilophus lunatus]|nr:STOX1 protein [Serilophus lunatus]